MNGVTIHRAMARLAGLDLFYLDSATAGPAILCLHGRWGRGETWSDFMRNYGCSYRVIAPDQRGHGLSGKPASSYTAEEMAQDMEDLMGCLGLEPVIVVGHSMGGRIAAHLAALHPGRVKAVAILDKSATGSALSGADAEDPLTKDWPMPFATLDEAQAFLRKTMPSELSYSYFMNSLAETVEGYRMMFSSQAMAANIAGDRDWFDLLPKLTCPVLLLRSGSHEAVPDADRARMQALIPDCTACEVTDPDHNVHLSDPAEFYRHFDQFLERIKP